MFAYFSGRILFELAVCILWRGIFYASLCYLGFSNEAFGIKRSFLNASFLFTKLIVFDPTYFSLTWYELITTGFAPVDSKEVSTNSKTVPHAMEGIACFVVAISMSFCLFIFVRTSCDFNLEPFRDCEPLFLGKTYRIVISMII